MDNVTIIRVVAGLIALALPLICAIFVGIDANKRGMNGILWGIGVFLLCIAFLPIYFIVRKPLQTQPQPYGYPPDPPLSPAPQPYYPPATPAIPSGGPPTQPAPSQRVHQFCANCGTKLATEAKFCPSCGRAV